MLRDGEIVWTSATSGSLMPVLSYAQTGSCSIWRAKITKTGSQSLASHANGKWNEWFCLRTGEHLDTRTHRLSVTFNQKILGLSIFHDDHDVKHAYLAFLEFLVIQYPFPSWHIGSSALCTLGTLSQIWNPCCRSPANSRIMLVFEHHLVLLKAQRKILFSTLNNSHRINLLHWIDLHAHARFFKIGTPFHSVCVKAEVDQYINNCKTSRAFLSATTLSMLDTTPHTDPLESRAVEPDVDIFTTK